jgi:membrane protease YdiL (CAAX protease family)
MDEIKTTDKLKSYKLVCAKLGAMMCVYFICRMIAPYFGGFFARLTRQGALSETWLYVIQGVISILMVYIVPLLFAALIFGSFEYYKGGRLAELYKKPKKIARSLGTFPAMYGLGYGIALLTLLTGWFISRLNASDEAARVEELFQPTAIPAITNVAGLIGMVFLLVVVAPVLEEIWMRGIVFDALGPYGYGVTIIISSLLFGLMHGSVYMLFYTTALGFALGYVRYATGSLWVVTVLHAIINAVAAGMLVLTSLVEMTGENNKLINTALNIYMIAMLVLIIAGVIAFITRIPIIRRYKIENAWTEISGGRKMTAFFLSLPVLIMLLLAFEEHTEFLLLGFLT